MSRIKELSRLARRVPALGRLMEKGDPGRRAALLVSTGLVDASLYARLLGVPSITAEDAALHYAREGHRLGLTINVLLDPDLLRRRLMPSGRPILYDYLNSRAWFAEASLVWDALGYAQAHPESLDHRGGPTGQLWESLTSGEAPTLEALPGGARDIPWTTLYEVLADALADHAERARRKVRRLAHPRVERPGSALDAWPAGDPQPLVSIVMPVWNRAGALRTAIDSVMDQTWQNWELIIVDDGSWDDTVRVAQTVGDRDPRVRVLRSAHVGVSGARNLGIGACTGDYVAFLDSDNTWEPDYLAAAVGGLHRSGRAAGFTTIALESESGTRYRDMPADRTSLLEGNSIDLNTFILSRSALDEAGGFDTSLARAVDYDLILRVAARHELLHIDTVGAVYDDRAESADRISNSEALGWNTRVRLANDPRATASGATLTAGSETIMLLQTEDPLLADKLERATTVTAHGSPTRLALVGPLAGETAAAAAAVLDRPGAAVSVFDADEPYAYVVNMCLALATREVVVVIDPRAEPTIASMEALGRAVVDSDAAAAIPVAIAPDGTLLGAGSGIARPGAVPHLLLARHPEADAPHAVTDVPLLCGRSFAAKTQAVRSAGGIDPLYFNDFELEGLSLALVADGGRLVIVPEARFWHPHTAAVFRRTDPTGNTRTIRSASADMRVGTGEDVYRLAGLEIAGWDDPPATDPSDGGPAPDGRPVVIGRRPAREVELGGRTVASLRWAIKIAAPAGPRGEAWGDVHFAQALARALRELGQDAVVDPRESVERPTRHLDDVDIVIRGLDTYRPRAAATSMLWVISHPDDVTRSEATSYDAVFAASIAWSRRMSERWRLRIEPLLQCTDPELFHPVAPESAHSDQLLFVGNSRWVPRPAVVAPIQAGVPVTVYGADWHPFIDPDAVTAVHVGNAEVGALYERAAAVLNDHWSDMRREGFIANRLFDVVAAGGRVISDSVEGIDELFGGAVHQFDDVDELLAAVTGPVDALFASDEEVQQVSERIRRDHSFLARARVLLDAALERR